MRSPFCWQTWTMTVLDATCQWAVTVLQWRLQWVWSARLGPWTLTSRWHGGSATQASWWQATVTIHSTRLEVRLGPNSDSDLSLTGRPLRRLSHRSLRGSGSADLWLPRGRGPAPAPGPGPGCCCCCGGGDDQWPFWPVVAATGEWRDSWPGLRPGRSGLWRPNGVSAAMYHGFKSFKFSWII